MKTTLAVLALLVGGEHMIFLCLPKNIAEVQNVRDITHVKDTRRSQKPKQYDVMHG